MIFFWISNLYWVIGIVYLSPNQCNLDWNLGSLPPWFQYVLCTSLYDKHCVSKFWQLVILILMSLCIQRSKNSSGVLIHICSKLSMFAGLFWTACKAQRLLCPLPAADINSYSHGLSLLPEYNYSASASTQPHNILWLRSSSWAIATTCMDMHVLNGAEQLYMPIMNSMQLGAHRHTMHVHRCIILCMCMAYQKLLMHGSRPEVVMLNAIAI